MLHEAENRVKIEGLLSETDLKYGSFVKDGNTIETIGGTIKVLVEQVVNGPITLDWWISTISTCHGCQTSLKATSSISLPCSKPVMKTISSWTGIIRFHILPLTAVTPISPIRSLPFALRRRVISCTR